MEMSGSLLRKPDGSAGWGCIFFGPTKSLPSSSTSMDTSDFRLSQTAYMLFHTFHGLFMSTKSLEYVLNPVIESTPMDEDFVGKVSRASRRMGADQQSCPSALPSAMPSCMEQQTLLMAGYRGDGKDSVGIWYRQTRPKKSVDD